MGIPPLWDQNGGQNEEKLDEKILSFWYHRYSVFVCIGFGDYVRGPKHLKKKFQTHRGTSWTPYNGELGVKMTKVT
jgi:hypothetical protein